ncbi:MAG: hypothetical protein R3C11_14310 [Planctomycetaceae bacterium]
MNQLVLNLAEFLFTFVLLFPTTLLVVVMTFRGSMGIYHWLLPNRWEQLVTNNGSVLEEKQRFLFLNQLDFPPGTWNSVRFCLYFWFPMTVTSRALIKLLQSLAVGNANIQYHLLFMTLTSLSLLFIFLETMLLVRFFRFDFRNASRFSLLHFLVNTIAFVVLFLLMFVAIPNDD